MMFKIGNLHIKRAYYQDKVTGEYLFLLDKLLNLPKYERLSNTCIKSVIEEATDSSYKKAGEKASISAGVSKQTVKNFMHKVKVPQEIVELKKKKEARILHIVADEDHVSLQRYGKNRQKIAMPKLIMLYEGVVPDAGEGMSSKRNKVIEKFYFSGLYKGKNSHKIWERVAEYIEKTYDYEKIEKIYINGDGAAWIKAGCDFIEKSVFVLDKYHMKSAINDCVAGLEEKIQRDIKDRLYRSLRELDKREFFRLLEMSKDFLEGQKKKAAVEEKIKYLRYHWRAIEIQITDAKYLTGCCAEGQVSHVLSSRLSSRPLGWSLVGLDNMARLRAFRCNQGNWADVVKSLREKNCENREVEQMPGIETIRANRKWERDLKIANCPIPAIELKKYEWLRNLVHGSKAFA